MTGLGDLLLADFNGDGKDDLAVPNRFSDDVVVLLNRSNAPPVSSCWRMARPRLAAAPITTKTQKMSLKMSSVVLPSPNR